MRAAKPAAMTSKPAASPEYDTDSRYNQKVPCKHNDFGAHVPFPQKNATPGRDGIDFSSYFKCLGRESNPHGDFAPRDFKSYFPCFHDFSFSLIQIDFFLDILASCVICIFNFISFT